MQGLVAVLRGFICVLRIKEICQWGFGWENDIISKHYKSSLPSYTVGENVSWYSHCGKQYGGSQKTKNRVTIWSSTFTPGHINRQNYNSKRYMHLCVHSSTIYSSQDMETTSIFIDRWMHKEDVVHIHKGILFSHKKEWNNAICSHVDGPRDYHSKWSQS